jgi:hypothetical protein
MTTVTTYVRDDETATLICPACKTVKHITAGKFRQGKHAVTVHCICQQTFNVLFDFRKYYRKQVNLPGTYEIISKGSIGGSVIQINNISRSGLRFTVSGLHRIEEGQKLRVEFELNDKKKTLLTREVIVKEVQQNTIGCQFKENVEMEKDLGFFLKS